MNKTKIKSKQKDQFVIESHGSFEDHVFDTLEEAESSAEAMIDEHDFYEKVTIYKLVPVSEVKIVGKAQRFRLNKTK